MRIRHVNSPEYTLYLAIYPVDDLKNDIHKRDILFVYPFRMTLFSSDKLTDVTEHLLKTYLEFNINPYGERCYTELILYSDNVYYDHDNTVVRLDPRDSTIQYGVDYSDITIPECDISKFKCYDTVNELRNGKDLLKASDDNE